MIRNLIFDFGGVIIDINTSLVGQSFKDLGIQDLRNVNQRAIDKGLYLDLEMGLITPEEFRDGLREVSGMPLTDQQIDDAWNSMILAFPERRFELLRHLKENYNIYLLSNTNEIHYHYFNSYVSRHMGVTSLDDLFTRCFYSHRMKLRKPDPEIFRQMLAQGNIDPAESLYIDDLAENVQAARELGIHSIIHNPEEEINQYFVNGRIRD